MMKMNRHILILISVVGIMTSCEGQLKPTSETPSEQINSIEKQQQLQRNKLSALAEPGSVDFRSAARLVTPGVVHVNSTWRTSEDRGNTRTNEALRDFFGDDFWFHFFEPYQDKGPHESFASGVILTADGYIITNNHAIEQADQVEIVLYDQRSYQAKVVGADPSTDLALLKIEETNLVFIPLGNSDQVEVGEWVMAVGNPFNLASTVTAGIVSAKARNINILRDRAGVESFIQTDAAVNPGNSGGALVNLKGELVGINTAIATPTGVYAGYSFAIPVNLVKKVADDLLNFGTVQRGYLGIIIRDMSGSLAKERGLKFTPGVYVDSLVEKGAAMEAGIKPGDIITQIDETPVETSPELQEIVAKHRPNEKLHLIVVRNGEKREVTVTLKETNPIAMAATEKEALIELNLGIEVQPISQNEKREYQLPAGLKVTSIKNGRVSQFTNMREGFIITKVNGKPVHTKAELIRIIGEQKGGIMMEGIYPREKDKVIYYGFGL